MRENYERPAAISERHSLTVNDIMSSPVVTAGEKTSVRDIAKAMNKHKIDAIVITNKNNEPIGVVTGGDIVKKLVSKTRNLLFSKAKHIMSRPVVTIKKHVKLEDAARYMAGNRIKKLCVVDDSNRAIGIITSSDITKNASYLIEVLEEIIETGYVNGEGGREL
ncbi:Inosine-5'-monophosphate dehydrogenase [uncultured archaeon]|nr:Inosine-5'-monophosphate dehydrogenase [uncultured archaeon]